MSDATHPGPNHNPNNHTQPRSTNKDHHATNWAQKPGATSTITATTQHNSAEAHQDTPSKEKKEKAEEKEREAKADHETSGAQDAT